MYLSMLQEEDTQALFITLAICVSIIDVRGDGEYVEEQLEGHGSEDISPNSFSISNEIKQKIYKIFSKKRIEQEQLRLYVQELAPSASSNPDMFISAVYSKVIMALMSVAETTNERLLNNQSLRIEFICEAVDQFFISEKDWFENISPEEKKVILFELTGLSFSDYRISDGERKFLDHICEKFDIDSQIIDEAKEIVERMQSLHNEGLELIKE